MNAISEAARGLFAVCAVAAGMEMLAGDRRASSAFRSVCALAVTLRALRLIAGLLGAG